MSILIKGMEMPKRCIDCPFMVSRDNDDCILQNDEANAKFNSWDDMKASCPLVEIPTPHGNLKDESDIISLIEVMFCKDKDGMEHAIQCVKDAPTVIEAEGSET